MSELASSSVSFTIMSEIIKLIKETSSIVRTTDCLQIMNRMTQSQLKRITQLPKFTIKNITYVLNEKMLELISKYVKPTIPMFVENISISTTFANLEIHKNRMAFSDELIAKVSKAVHEQGLKIVIPNMTNIKFNSLPDSFQIPIKKGKDKIITMCHEGMNRSQICNQAAIAITTQEDGTNQTFYPHGAESGFYPYRCSDVLNNENWFEWIHGRILDSSQNGEWLHQIYNDVFGCDKEPRYGQKFNDFFDLELNPDETSPDIDFSTVALHRKILRKLMDTTLYDINYLLSNVDSDGELVMICFMRSGGISLERILDLNPEADLSRLRVYCIPLVDTISSAGGKTERSELIINNCLNKIKSERNLFLDSITFNTYFSYLGDDWTELYNKDIWLKTDCDYIIEMMETSNVHDSNGLKSSIILRNYISKQQHIKLFKNFCDMFVVTDTTHFGYIV
jgi:hypothetical protein